MSHGMVAPLTALSKAYARGYNDIEVKDAIVRLKKFYDEGYAFLPLLGLLPLALRMKKR